MLPEQLAKQKDSRFNSISVKSALNPALWLVAAAGTIGLFGLFYFSTNPLLSIFFACVIGLPLLCTCVAFLYFVFSNPERLQSEDFQLRAESLRIVKSKGGKLRQIDSRTLEVINNPARLALPLAPAEIEELEERQVKKSK